MSSQVRPVSTSITPPDPSRCKILESRNQYRACHVRVPDSDDRLAAIVISDRYYSFFRLIKDSDKTLQVAAKLVYRGDEVAITRTLKGDVIWIYEADAQEGKTQHKRDPVQPVEKAQAIPPSIPRLSLAGSGLWKFLTSDRDYQVCQIRVPDVAKPMSAIYTERQYYSHLRTVREQSQAIELAERLSNKGHAARITQTGKGWAVWVLEAEASIRT